MTCFCFVGKYFTFIGTRETSFLTCWLVLQVCFLKISLVTITTIHFAINTFMGSAHFSQRVVTESDQEMKQLLESNSAEWGETHRIWSLVKFSTSTTPTVAEAALRTAGTHRDPGERWNSASHLPDWTELLIMRWNRCVKLYKNITYIRHVVLQRHNAVVVVLYFQRTFKCDQNLSEEQQVYILQNVVQSFKELDIMACPIYFRVFHYTLVLSPPPQPNLNEFRMAAESGGGDIDNETNNNLQRTEMKTHLARVSLR